MKKYFPVKSTRLIKFLVTKIFCIKLNERELSGKFNFFTNIKLKIIHSANLPFNIGRTNRGLSFKNNYFIYTGLVNGLAKNNNKSDLYKKLFEEFEKYKNYTIKNIKIFSFDSNYNSLPLWSMVAPWQNTNLDTLNESYLFDFYKNRVMHGLKFRKMNKNEILNMMYSKNSAISQFKQFKNLYDKISRTGYEDNLNDLPTAIILHNNKKWIWIIESGNHRAYIKHEIGYKQINCRIVKVINANKPSKCSNVRNNLYSIDEASLFFKRVFEGKYPIRGIV